MIPAESTILAPNHTQHVARCDYCLDLYRVDVCATVTEPWPIDRCDSEARRAEAAGAAALMEATAFL